MADLTVEAVVSGASQTVPVRAGELKKGHYVMLKDHPCKVIELTTSKTGKHGHAKANITGVDIFTGNKYMDVSPTSHTMSAPVVTPTEWTLLDVNTEDVNADGHYATMLQNAEGESREDLFLPTGEEYEKMMEDFESGELEITVTVLSACGTDKIMPQYKSNKA